DAVRSSPHPTDYALEHGVNDANARAGEGFHTPEKNSRVFYTRRLVRGRIFWSIPHGIRLDEWFRDSDDRESRFRKLDRQSGLVVRAAGNPEKKALDISHRVAADPNKA
ncbi:MAG: hypothetical protein ACU843_18445, partial [Gammaproteobacteria bacterium]